MAFAQIPKDINKIETKLVSKFTKRQIITFIFALAIAGAGYFIFYKYINKDIALTALILLAFPIFFLGLYKKDDEYLEKHIINFLKRKVLNNEIRKFQGITKIEEIDNIYQQHLFILNKSESVKKE